MTSAAPHGGNTADQKPRVLVVDDHRGILDRVIELLANEFDIAGSARDGYEAIETARRTTPDAIVLDINMPGLDGFRTLDALGRNGSKAPVVFLSMLDSAEEIDEAFRRGGRGYVVKSHMGRDLPRALDHVLRGRRFAPSLVSLADQTPDGGHGLHLLDDGGAFVEDLAALFHRALERGDATCAISTPDVRAKLAARLGDLGWRVDGHPRYRAIDAATAITQFMRDGLPDESVIKTFVDEFDQYRRAVGASRLTVFGNMSALLSIEGQFDAARAVETTWDRLTLGLPFLTVCGYSAECFQDGAADHWPHVCAAHSIVSHASHL